MNLGWVKYQMGVALQRAGSCVLVTWVDTAGGTLDVNGALVGGTAYPGSGVMQALGSEEPARSVVRQYAEIQAGDLLLDVDAAALVTRPDGTKVSLDALDAPRFRWGDTWYVQKEAGGGLASALNAMVAGERFYRTLLLRRAT